MDDVLSRIDLSNDEKAKRHWVSNYSWMRQQFDMVLRLNVKK